MKNTARIERIELPVPFPPGSTNCYFIPDSTPTLIDAGTNAPEALQSLRSGLRKLGAGIDDIRRIILTHGHIDHAGLAGAVAGASGSPVFVHFWDKDRASAGSEESGRENAGLFHRLFEEAGVPKEIAREATSGILNRFRKHLGPLSEIKPLEGGEVFSFDLFKLRVLHTPGHTAGSICLFEETDGLLFSGDCLIEGIIPYASAELRNPAGLERYYPIEHYGKSLDLLSALPVGSVLPGHGRPFNSHRKLIERMRRNRTRRRQRILELLKVGTSGMSQYDVLKRLFLCPSSAGSALFMGISEVRGCLEMMEEEGLVATAVNDGKRAYRLNCEPSAKKESIMGCPPE